MMDSENRSLPFSSLSIGLVKYPPLGTGLPPHDFSPNNRFAVGALGGG